MADTGHLPGRPCQVLQDHPQVHSRGHYAAGIQTVHRHSGGHRLLCQRLRVLGASLYVRGEYEDQDDITILLQIRRMLSLIWSGEATIRDAVVAAYKRLYIEGEKERGSERVASAATARWPFLLPHAPRSTSSQEPDRPDLLLHPGRAHFHGEDGL